MFDPSIPVMHFVKQPLVCVKPLDLLSEVAASAKAHGIKHFPVCEQGNLVGMVTYTDLLRMEHGFTVFNTKQSRSYNRSILDSLLVKDIMTEEVATISSTATAKEAADAFRHKRYHSLVIVGEDGQTPIGILTVMDLLHYAYDAGAQ